VAYAENMIKVIEQTHSWGDCAKYRNSGLTHCHCSLEVATLRTGETRTCRHCSL
jgi:hypothetical protein